MPESADLLAAVAAAPADDLPRLVYADWLDDRGEPDYATFVRDQIRLAQVPSWDPLAVRARHQRKETLGIGRPFYGTLPELPLFLNWHSEKAFRRGFGTGVVVNQLSGLIEAGPQLFDLAPVDELWLGAASLDEWRTVARSPWLKNIRKVHLHFSQSLHEPIRCLAESPYSGNIDEIWFDTLATPAAGAVIEILAQSPLARQLTGLHLRLIHQDCTLEIIQSLAKGKFDHLTAFSFTDTYSGQTPIDDFFAIPAIQNISVLKLQFSTLFYYTSTFTECIGRLHELQALSFGNNYITYDSTIIQTENWPEKLRHLEMISCSYSAKGQAMIFDSLNNAKNLKCLNISRNNYVNKTHASFSNSRSYRQLVEIDLSMCAVSSTVANHYLKTSVPEQLISIVLSKNLTNPKSHSRLESHFGDRLVWAADDAATGLAR